MNRDPKDTLSAALALGQNGGMPTRLELADLPPDASRAHQAIAGHARVAVLRYLLDNPAMSRPRIVEGTGVSAGGVRSALQELEALGYVLADVQAPRRGQRIRYTANRAALTDDLTAFVAWMLR